MKRGTPIIYVGMAVMLAIGYAAGHYRQEASRDDQAKEIQIGILGYFIHKNVTHILLTARPIEGFRFPTDIFILHEGGDKLSAFYGREPYFDCVLDWRAEDERFVDICHEYSFDRTGNPVLGPEGRSLPLRHFQVQVRDDVYRTVFLILPDE